MLSTAIYAAPGRLPCLQLAAPRARHLVARAGKDKKAGSGGKKSALADLLKKKEAAAQEAAARLWDTPETRALLLLTANSYWRHTGQYMIEASFDQLAAAVFNAPFVLLIHDRFQAGVTDPRFIYANRAALELWEAEWQQLVGQPSRLSAADEPSTQQDRQQLLDKAADTGIIRDYAGWRVSATGKRFRIRGVDLFNVQEPDGTKVGQAALFTSYELENGQEVQVQGYAWEAAGEAGADAQATQGMNLPPSADEIAAAEQAVAGWGAHIRMLKGDKGMTNKDPEVQAAVASLQAWKTQLASLQQRLEQELAAARAAFDDDEEEDEGEGAEEGAEESRAPQAAAAGRGLK